MEQLKRFRIIAKSFDDNYFCDLGKIEMIIDDDSTLDTIKFSVIPFEGIHKNVKYIVTIKFQELNSWPLIYINSELYDKIKTNFYLQNKGRNGNHKGICIKNLGYGYNFTKNFKELCDCKWENYIFYLITVFNNLQDFTKGNGIKTNYKNILNI